MTTEQFKILMVEITLEDSVAYEGKCPFAYDKDAIGWYSSEEERQHSSSHSNHIFFSNRYRGRYFIPCAKHLHYFRLYYNEKHENN